MRSRAPLFALLLLVGSFAFPLSTYAGIPFFGPIIPPGFQSCAAGWGAVMIVINNIISLLLTLAIVFVAPLMIAWAGFLFVVNPVNAGGKEQAKKILTNTIVGIVIALAGWLIVDAIMAVLYKPNASNGGTTLTVWYNLVTGSGDYCLQQAASGYVTGTPPPPPTVVVGVPGCPTCVSLTSKGLTCKIASSCTLDQTVANKLVSLKNNFSGTWTVTEAFPPTVTHTNACHNNGTCIDAGFRGSTTYTDVNVAAFSTAASSAGLRPVFETFSCSLRDQARARGVTAYCVTDSGYSHITGNHFSVYAN